MTEQEYLRSHGYELMRVRFDGKKKLPAHRGWLDAPPLPGDVDGPVGVRARPRDLIIDIDPRNGGSLSALNFDVGPYPVVETPSGGWHIYMQKPPELKVRHTLAELPGIEFKTRGRFVMAPGCINPLRPDKPYRWETGCEGMLPAPMAPDSILALIEVSSSSPADDTMGVWSPARLARELSKLRVEDHRDHDDWFALMCASHEVTGGLGCEEFVAWSIEDPEYALAGDSVRARWGTLTVGKDGGAGVGTLRSALLAEGQELEQDEVVTDFDDVVEEQPVGVGSKGVRLLSETVMQRLTREYACVDEDGRLRVFCQRRDDVMNRWYWVRYARRDFLEVCQSVMNLGVVEHGQTARGEPKLVPAGRYWIDAHKKKRTYTGVVFAPEHPVDKTPDGRLNLWQGFAVKPDMAGSWAMLKELVWETLCDMDNASYEYVMRWMARAVQMPWMPGETALVFKGKKGLGKGTLGRAFIGLFGRHGMHVTSPSLLTGRFNAHLRDCCALFADEAFWAGDRTGEGVLKGLVTEPALTYEGKGTNAEMGRNCVHVVMASNSDWVVPAGMDERRFAVFQARDDKHAREWWGRLREERGWMAAMLWELQNMDLHGFDVSRVPGTRALAEQKIRSMGPVEQWVYEMAQSTDWLGMTVLPDSNEHNVYITCEDVHASYTQFCERSGLRHAAARASQTVLGFGLKKLVPYLRRERRSLPTSGGQHYVYRFPTSELILTRLESEIGCSLEVGNEEEGRQQ